MSARGILFKPDLHEAIRAGRKTVTRRLDLRWAKLRKGDWLYVKEKLVREYSVLGDYCKYALGGAYVRALDPVPGGVQSMDWHWNRDWLSPLHMPREAARTWLVLTEDARIERLHDITEGEARAEGIRALTKDGKVVKYAFLDQGDMSSLPWTDMPRSAREAFRARWDEMRPGSWDTNPEVVVLRFKLLGCVP